MMILISKGLMMMKIKGKHTDQQKGGGQKRSSDDTDQRLEGVFDNEDNRREHTNQQKGADRHNNRMNSVFF